MSGTYSHRQFLSGSWLKVIALLSMTVDHVALFFLRENPVPLFSLLGVTVTLYRVLRLAGRMAFPIYGFLIAEGYLYTRNRARYGLALLLLAIVSQIPWSLRFSNLNVIVTLFCGYLGIWVYEAFRGRPFLRIFALLLLVAFLVIFPSDGGYRGFGFVLAMHILRRHETGRAVIGTCLLSSPFSVLGFLPIHFYSGKRGFLGRGWEKYFFYLYYPLHLLILFWLSGSPA